jgi:hypothetical protein
LAGTYGCGRCFFAEVVVDAVVTEVVVDAEIGSAVVEDVELVFPESDPIVFFTVFRCPPAREVVLVLDVESVSAAFVVAAGVGT